MEVLGLIDVPLSLLLTVGAVILLYLYGTWNHNFFRKQGIPGPKPMPFIGNTTQVGFMHQFHDWRQKYGNVFGMFFGGEPTFVISDLDILKEVFIKSFDNFKNRRRIPLLAPPFNLALFFLEDQAWRRVRNIVSPTFSGGKLRAMLPSINENAKTLIRNFTNTLGKGRSVDMKKFFGAFTMDVIASTSFGINVDSQNNFDDPFVKNAIELFNPPKARSNFILLGSAFPFIARIIRALGINVLVRGPNNFFAAQVKQIVRQREQEPRDMAEKRTDFLKLMMDAKTPAKNGTKSQSSNGHVSNGHSTDLHRQLTTDELVAQGIIFFVAGYETTASTLNFASFALANNPEVQEKAYQEIKDKLGDDEPTYDNIGQLKYLENVITETLRLFPPVQALHRRASETITLKGVTIPRGSTVFIPLYSIQRDPELFHDPEAFKPERHEENNKQLSFLAFGQGPRICIGMRLALVETKVALVHVLRALRFEKAPDTPSKFKYNLNTNILQPEIPNLLRVIARD